MTMGGATCLPAIPLTENPLWDETGMQFTLDFCAQLVETVPCYELGFVPHKDVLELVRDPQPARIVVG
jgi:hypothetical protein